MYETATWMTEALWRNGLAVVPLAVVIWAVIRWGVTRPATRHLLWLGALAWLVVGVLIPPAEFLNDELVASLADSTNFSVPTVDSDAATVESAPRELDAAVNVTKSELQENFEAELFTDSSYIGEKFLRDDVAAVPLERVSSASSREEVNNTDADRLFISEPRIRETTGESAEAIDATDSLICQDPTPPTTVARSELRVPSPQIEAHGPVGRSSPFSMGDEISSFKSDESSSSTVALAARQPAVESADVPGASDSEKSMALGTTVTPSNETGGFSRVALSSWATYWLRLRNNIAAIPPIPASIWFGVVFLILAIRAASCVRLHRRLSDAKPAPYRVQALVNACAASIGVRRAPQARFVNDRVSPMLLCIPRPQLILPKALWSELDRAGRRAVILHELAHLKRRDHWTHWFELLVGVVYWWHPVIWWMRQRLRDEAENACDAWVTWFEPKQRRAYAAALLQAQKFLSESGQPTPVPAVGVVSHRANRIARRLTMVMTHRVSPKASSSSVFALPVLFLMAWSIVPAKSTACPPTSDTPDAIDVAPEGQKFIRGRIESDADSFVVFVSDHGMKICQQAPPKNVMTKHNYGDCTIYIAQESDCNPAAVEAPIVNIKPDVQEIVVYPIASPRGVEVTAGPARPAPFNKKSASIHGRRVNLEAGPQYGTLAVADAPSDLSSVPVQIAIPTTDADGNWALISEIPADAVSPVLAVGTAGGSGVAWGQPDGEDSDHRRWLRIAQAPRTGGGSAHSHGDDDDRIARLERQISNLSKQLAELSESLHQRHPGRLPHVQVAPPVGMTITPTPPNAPSGTLWLNRTPSAAGGPMIARKYTLTDGKLEALTKLMVRSDVKTRVRPLDDGIEVQGTAADHEKFALFIELISGEGMDHKVTYHLPEEKMADLTRLMERDDVPVFIHRGEGEITVQGNELVQRVFKDFLELLNSSGDAVSTSTSITPEYASRMGDAVRAYTDAAKQQLAVEQDLSSAKKRAEIDRLRVKAQQLQQQAETLEQRADELVEQAEETAEEAAAIKERGGSDAAKADYRRMVDELKLRAKEFGAQAEATYREAQDLEANADSIEEQIDRLEDELAVALSGR